MVIDGGVAMSDDDSQTLYKLIIASDSVDLCRRMVRDGSRLGELPQIVVEIIQHDYWRKRFVNKELVEFEDFRTFCATPPMEGLGFDWHIVRNLCRDSAEAVEALDRVTQAPVGRAPIGAEAMTGAERMRRQRAEDTKVCDETLYNIQDFVTEQGETVAPTGTSVQAGMRALRAHRPDLLEDVIAERISVHAACVQAGLRRRTITVPVDVEATVRAIARHFAPDDIEAIATRLAALRVEGAR